ncbi:MAG: hypothetical protein IPM29_22935 [Planctomycetes bacterium]|nr:hypothetical protein [Planctomycetota bacterium]
MATPLRRRDGVLLLLVLGASATSLVAQRNEPEFATVERRFRELPPEARRLTGPLFWLHGDESEQRLRDLVAKVQEGGNGTLTAESRPHSDWLGPGWYRDLATLLDECKRQGLEMWIFDERWWPSQAVGGTVPPSRAAKRLTATAVDVDGGVELVAADHAGERHIASLAGRLVDGDAVELASLVDLAPFVDGGTLRWTPPAGRWRIMRFAHETAPGLGQGGGRELSVDGMSRDCVQWLIDTVYQPHFDRFGDDFGATIRGYFYDEPETRGDWGTELPVVLRERGVDWKAAYVARACRLAGEAQAAYLFQYLDARAEAWGRVMYGMTTKWCEDHGVRSIGHFMEHGGLYRHQDFCAGDMMQLQKYSSMGGIDAVFRQFAWGRRDVNDTPCWQTPKLGSSISHVFGKPDDLAMVEIFGARGQDLSYPEMKWWTDAMQVAGINFLIPHSFNPRAPFDSDCPPYFYDGGYEPRFPLYRVFADYTSRLSVMLSGGRHVAPVALVTPGQSFAVGDAIPVEGVSASLQDALYDCDWIPYEVLENTMRIDGAQLSLHDERYRVLCLPAAEVVPVGVLEKAVAFFEAGGVVVAYGMLPSRSATPGTSSADIAALRSELFGDARPSLAVCRRSEAGGRSYFLPTAPTPEQWQQVLAGDAGIRPTLEVVDGITGGWLHVLHRVKAGRDVFFVTNQNVDGGTRRFRLRVEAAGVPEHWDAMRNEITALGHERDGSHVMLEIELEPNDSALLVFAPEERRLPRRPAAGGTPLAALPVARVPSPPAPPLPALEDDSPARALVGCAWVWYPEGDPQRDAPVGSRFFRKRFELPEAAVTRARFVLTADNHAALWVNGETAGATPDVADAWRRPVVIEVAEWLRPGPNLLALCATNAEGTAGNPAGLIGVLTVELSGGASLRVPIDDSWRCASHVEEWLPWTQPEIDDADWLPARKLAPFGAAPWGRVGAGRLTLSPVTADPFDGEVEIPADLDRSRVRLVLAFDDPAPEAACRVEVDGHYVGGCLGRPFRLDLTEVLTAGRHRVRLLPFAPANVRVEVRGG